MENINLRSRQKGASMWMLLFTSGMFIFLALISMKLLPAYLANNKIAHALETLTEQPGIGSWTRGQMIQRLSDTLYVDMASDMLDLHESLVISKAKSVKVISIDYETVIPMAFNISALLDFENSVEVSLK